MCEQLGQSRYVENGHGLAESTIMPYRTIPSGIFQRQVLLRHNKIIIYPRAVTHFDTVFVIVFPESFQLEVAAAVAAEVRGGRRPGKGAARRRSTSAERVIAESRHSTTE